MDIRIAGVTVSPALALMPTKLALIVTEPTATALASPVLMVATAVFEDVHATFPVKS
jgi:hypothetical protein